MADNVLEKLAAQGLTLGMNAALAALPIDRSIIFGSLRKVAQGIEMLCDMGEDGKITDVEVENVLETIGATGDSTSAIALKAVMDRVIMLVLSKK